MPDYSVDTQEWIDKCDANIRPYAKIGWFRGVLIMSAIKNQDGHIDEFVHNKGSVCWRLVNDSDDIKTLPIKTKPYRKHVMWDTIEPVNPNRNGYITVKVSAPGKQPDDPIAKDHNHGMNFQVVGRGDEAIESKCTDGPQHSFFHATFDFEHMLEKFLQKIGPDLNSIKGKSSREIKFLFQLNIGKYINACQVNEIQEYITKATSLDQLKESLKHLLMKGSKMTDQRQTNIGSVNAKQIGPVDNYFEGKEINIGLSAEDMTQIIQAIKQLEKEDRGEFEKYLQQIREAKTQEEKKSIARKASEFIRKRGLGIFDSLVAGVILLLPKGSQ